MRGSSALVVALAIAAAGCLGGSPSASESPLPAPTSPTDVAGAGMDTEPRENATTDPIFLTLPIAFSGKTATAACYHAETTADCHAAEAGKDTHHAIALEGVPVRLAGSIAYTSTLPGGTFGAFVCIERPDETFACPDGFRGASPLAVDWDLAEFANATSLLMGVYHQHDPTGGAPAQAWLSTPAEFKVEATLTTVVV